MQPKRALQLPALPDKRSRTALRSGGAGGVAADETAEGGPAAQEQQQQQQQQRQHAAAEARSKAHLPGTWGPEDGDCAAELAAPGALPNDTLAALQLLRAQFPKKTGCPAFATRAQLYCLLRDRTAVDRQLSALQHSNAVRLFQLPSGSEEQAIQLTADYEGALARCKQQLLQQQQQQQQQQQLRQGQQDEGKERQRGAYCDSSGGAARQRSGAAATAAVAAGPVEVLDWFRERVLPACPRLQLTHADLLSLLSGAAPSSSRPLAANGAAQAHQASEAHVQLLLQHCFLTRHTSQPDAYLFSMPGAGSGVRSVAAGRQELLGALQRRRHPEMLENELEKRKLQRSLLGVRWHVRDLLGSGALMRLDTPAGPMVRVARRQK